MSWDEVMNAVDREVLLDATRDTVELLDTVLI
jgi:hypothetical protein